MNINEILKKPEGRRLEFKETMQTQGSLPKTVIAFANDAGGEIYIGVRDNPRGVVGLPEDKLVELEEQISNIIYNCCYPTIIPDISFLTVEDKYLIKIIIYRGNMPPYYLKEKGKTNGTYIRVGSANRLADASMIEELERKKRNISFDSEPAFDKPAAELDINEFKSFFHEKTGEELNTQSLKKLELIKEYQGIFYPTNALILFSDDELRNSHFYFAKVECARFKA